MQNSCMHSTGAYRVGSLLHMDTMTGSATQIKDGNDIIEMPTTSATAITNFLPDSNWLHCACRQCYKVMDGPFLGHFIYSFRHLHYFQTVDTRAHISHQTTLNHIHTRARSHTCACALTRTLTRSPPGAWDSCPSLRTGSGSLLIALTQSLAVDRL